MTESAQVEHSPSELWEHWTKEEWNEDEVVWKQEELEGAVYLLKHDLKKEDWDKLYQHDYVKEHFATEDATSCILNCDSVDEIKKKIVSHFD